MKEMKSREFREIQVSSSLLVIIFLGVLALGIFVFLLGVSVGKKQVRITANSQVVAQAVRETAAELSAGKTEGDLGGVQGQAASGGADSSPQTQLSASPKVELKTKSPGVLTPASPSGSGLYYVQVGAFLEKKQALDLAETYRKQGYTVMVTEPRPDDRQPWHRVRLGGFTSRERAEDLLKGLNAAARRKTDFRVIRD